MFLDHDWPGPRRDLPRMPVADKRNTTAATTLILLVSAIALGAPVAGGTMIALVLAVAKSW